MTNVCTLGTPTGSVVAAIGAVPQQTPINFAQLAGQIGEVIANVAEKLGFEGHTDVAKAPAVCKMNISDITDPPSR